MIKCSLFEYSGALLSLVAVAHAATHELIVGTFNPTISTPSLYTLEFDDEALTLNLIANTSVPAAGSWLALSVCTSLGSHDPVASERQKQMLTL